MRLVSLFALAFGLGFLTAMPIGGSQIEAAKRAMYGHLKSAFLVVLGSVASDTTYGLIALFGLAPFLRLRWVTAAFNVAGALVLWGLAFFTLRESRRPPAVRLESAWLTRMGHSFVTGYSLAVTNPQMVLTWLWGAAFAHRLGLLDTASAAARVVFVAGGVLGLGSYLTALSLTVRRMRHFIRPHTISRVYFWLGLALIALSGFFVWQAVRLLTGRS